MFRCNFFEHFNIVTFSEIIKKNNSDIHLIDLKMLESSSWILEYKHGEEEG